MQYPQPPPLHRPPPPPGGGGYPTKPPNQPPAATTYTWYVSSGPTHQTGQPLLSYSEAVYQGANVLAGLAPGNGTLSIVASLLGSGSGGYPPPPPLLPSG